MTYDFVKSDRTGPFWTGLKQRGYLIEEARLDEMPILRVTAPGGNHWLTSTNIAYPMTSNLVAQIASNKELAYKLVGQLGFAVPWTRAVTKGTDCDDIDDILRRYGTVIVKPRDSFGSRGVTLGIASKAALETALDDALAHSDGALIQEEVFGEELRFTVLDGKVQSVLLRRGARIVGDGRSTIAELIVAENERRQHYNRPYITYPQLDAAIIPESLLDDTTVLPEGEIYVLNRATMVRGGATIYEVIDEVHDSYIKIVESLARQLAVKFIVADIFIDDHTTAAADNYWFNEFNVSPALRLYFAAVNKDLAPLADNIINAFDKAVTKGL